MKNNTEKEQPIPESTTANEPVSSAALTLQLLTKEKEKIKEATKKESADEAAKVRCKVCFKEIAPKRLCSGHGGGGGGNSASFDKKAEVKASQGEDKSLTQSHQVVGAMGTFIDEFSPEKLDLESNFDPEVIAELIAKELLLVDSDRESKTITIKLICEPSILTDEQREELKKFMEAIIAEFNKFKEKHNLSDDCFKIHQDEKGNILSLRITMPTLALYDAFIQRLANNLVPIPSLKAQKREEVTKAQSLIPNPFSMEPNPVNKSSKQEEIRRNMDVEPEKTEKDKEVFSPTPFNMKPW